MHMNTMFVFCHAQQTKQMDPWLLVVTICNSIDLGKINIQRNSHLVLEHSATNQDASHDWSLCHNDFSDKIVAQVVQIS